MEKQISLTFGNLIAHLVPGVIALLILMSEQSSDCTFPEWFTKNGVLVATGFLSLSLAIGLFLDSVRYLLVRLVCLIPAIARRQKYQRFPRKDNLEEYNWVIENYYRHHQFCGNLALASVLLFRLTPETVCPLLPVILTLILGFSAIWMYKGTVETLNEAFPKQ